MKKITFIIINSILFSQFLIGQTLNQDALWPNSSWTVEGTYDSSEITDPTISANFSYNDDAAGGSSTDEIQVQSPTIDLTAASNAGETWIEVVHSYNYNLGTSFTLEYYDADTASWSLWNDLPDNSSTTSNWCGNLTPNTSSILDIGSFTASQLTGFRYRFNYNASNVWGWGVCTSSPTITSQAPPSCLEPSALSASNATTSSLDLSWTVAGTESQWNIEYGIAGYSQGSGTTVSASTNPYTLNGLSSGTSYDIYIQSVCGASDTSDWVGPSSFTTVCDAISSFPWTEDFESVTAPALPSCFSELNNNSDTDYWKTYSGYGTSSSNAAGMYTDYNNGSNDDYLILPQFTLTGSERFLYSVRARSASEPNDYKVVLSTTGNSAADFTTDLIDLTTVSSTTYEEQIIDLSAYSGDVYIAIHVPSGGLDGWYIYFDDFTVEVPSVDTMDWNNLQWVQPTADASSGSTTSVTVEVGTQISAYSQGYKAGLTDTTTGSAAAGVECWIGIHNEDTDPSTWPSSAWNIATFDSEQGNNDEYLLTTTNAPIGTNYVASRWRVNSGLYTYGGYNGPWDGITNTSVELVVTPVAGDTFSTATDLPFTISTEGTGCGSHDLSVDFSTSGPGYTASGLSSQGTTSPGYDAFFNWTATTDGLRWWGNGTGNPYISILDSSGNEIDYSTYGQSDVVLQGWSVGDDLVIRIYDYGTAQLNVQFCLELFTLPQAPNCAENLAPTGTEVPFNNGAVTISWDAPTTGPAPTDYEVFWGTESGNLTSIGLVGDPTTTSVNITGLEYGGTYYFSVVPQNGGTLATGCAEASFTVENASIPFNCDFANYPAGFTEASGAFGSPTGTASSWVTADFLNDATLQKGAKVNIYGTGIDEYLISPSFDLSSGTHYLNVKAGITDWNMASADPAGMDSGDDYVSILQSEDDGSTWTELYRWDSNSGLTNESSSISEIMLSSTSSTAKFAFYAFSGASGGDYDFHITDFRITSTSLGIEDNSISLFNYFPNPVNDVLTIKAQKDVDNITVYNMLGQVVIRQTPNTRDCTVDLSTMQTGAYFVQVSIDNSVETVRILKN